MHEQRIWSGSRQAGEKTTVVHVGGGGVAVQLRGGGECCTDVVHLYQDLAPVSLDLAPARLDLATGKTKRPLSELKKVRANEPSG